MFDWIFDVIGWIVRVLFFQVLATLFEKLFYWPGWLLLRLITWGRYPPPAGARHDRAAVALFAFIVIAIVSGLSAQFIK